jgi:hypothetical protein
MGNSIHPLFFVRKTAKASDGKVPIYLRITINGLRFETSIGKQVNSEIWVAKAGRVKGLTKEDRTLNGFLDTLKSRVINYEQEIFREGRDLNIETFRGKWLGIKDSRSC